MQRSCGKNEDLPSCVGAAYLALVARQAGRILLANTTVTLLGLCDV